MHHLQLDGTGSGLRLAPLLVNPTPELRALESGETHTSCGRASTTVLPKRYPDTQALI